MSLDVKIADGVWLEIWTDGADDHMESTPDIMDGSMPTDYRDPAGMPTDMYNEYMNSQSDPATMYDNYMNTANDMYNDYMNTANDMYNDYMNTGADGSGYTPADYSLADPYYSQSTDYMPSGQTNYMPAGTTATDPAIDYSKYDTEIYDTEYGVQPVRIEERDAFQYLVFEMSQDFFRDTVQLELGKTESTIPVDMRIAFKNAYGEPIAYTRDVAGVPETVELVDDFVVTIYGNDEVTGCESVTATLYASAATEHKLSFSQYDTLELNEFTIDNALEATLSDPNADCAVKFKLTCYDRLSSTWRLWDDLVKDFKTDAGRELSSEVRFNPDAGNLYVKFSNFDVEALTARLTDPVSGGVELQYRVAAYVAGSASQGAGASPDSLVKAEIKFTLLAAQTVADCSTNTLVRTDFTEAQEYRDLAAYDIPTGSVLGSAIEIPARVVKPTVDGCPMTTVIEFMDASGYWCEQRGTADGTTVIDMALAKTATFKFYQAWYLETALEKYYGVDPASLTNAGAIPEQLTIIGRFKTVDDSNPSAEPVYDEFELVINSSLETPTELCATAFSGISFAEGSEMTVARTYDVTDANEEKSIYIPTTLAGTENLAPSCAAQLNWSLDY
jgi:hypothetical protein